MSSERAGGLNRDWPGRADVIRSYGGELDQDMVDQLDRAHTPSERAGTPTHGTLNREQARDAAFAIFNDEDVWDHGYGRVIERLLDALEACVVLDPRIPDSAAYRAGVQAVLDRARAEAGSNGLVSLRGLENEFDE